MAFVIDKSKCRPCKCGCGELTSGIRKYRNGKYFYPEYCHGHHMVGKSGTSHPTFGKPSWNAGLTKDVSPTLAKMGYQPGHQPYNDFSKINNLLKSDPDFKEKWRLAKKGKTPWNKLKPFDAIRKEKHWNWKGGKPSHPRDYADYKLFRKKMYQRDKYTCQICGDRNHEGRGKRIHLHIHHIISFITHPHLALDPSNVIVVCQSCHHKIHTAR